MPLYLPETRGNFSSTGVSWSSSSISRVRTLQTGHRVRIREQHGTKLQEFSMDLENRQLVTCFHDIVVDGYVCWAAPDA